MSPPMNKDNFDAINDKRYLAYYMSGATESMKRAFEVRKVHLK